MIATVDKSPGRRSTVPLLVSSFFMAFSMSMVWVALPYIDKWLGGSDTLVGLSSGLFWGAYAVGCILCGSVLHHLDPKRATQAGCGIMILSILFIGGIVVWRIQHGPDIGTTPALLLSVLSIPYGLGMALFWPYVMSWLSTGHEGRKLNLQLALFNASFTIANILSPSIGAYFLSYSYTMPLYATIVSLAGCLICVSIPHRPSRQIIFDKPVLSEIKDTKLFRFRWMTRIGLLVLEAVLGLVRGLLPLLFLILDLEKFNMAG